MAPPVWVLSVDLQTKTATFTSGLADAARSARGSFNDIKTGAAEAGRATGTSMTEARHGVMLLGEEFGVHLPRALTSFIAGIGPIGATMEEAFPFLAIAVGATLLIEHLGKVREEAEKLERTQIQFGTATNNAFNALNAKMLAAEIQADELNKDHIGALKHQLELIDQQSMEDLVHSFDLVAKAADAVFAELKSHWYTQGIGADGAKHALEDFKTQYDSLIAQGKDKEASDLLSGTLQSAEHILAMQKQFQSSQVQYGNGQLAKPTSYGDGTKFAEAELALKKAGVGVTHDEVTSQEMLVTLLRSQLNAETEIGKKRDINKSNATRTTSDTVSDEAYSHFRKQAEDQQRADDEAYNRAKEAYDRTITLLQTNEREKIAATKQGSAERLQALDAAIKEEEKRGLEETSFYQSLGVQRIETIRQMATEEARIKEEAGKEAAAHASKMGELQLAAERETAQLLNSGRRVSAQEQAAQDKQLEEESYALKLAALNKQITALDKSDKDYDNKLRALYNRQEEMEREHQQKLTDIKDRAEMEQNQKALAAMTKFVDISAHGLTDVIMRHQSFAQMVASIGEQVLSGLMDNAIKSALLMDFGKEKEAAKAARQMFIAGTHFPFPANIVMAPALGAMAFASMMAFNEGGLVPGIGNRDTVPAMLTPGEHVADRQLTEGLRNMVRDGGGGPRHVVHLNYRPTYHVNTIDGNGIRDTLQQHADEFHQHFEQTIRRMNQ